MASTSADARPGPEVTPDVRRKERGAWRTSEVHLIPYNNLWVVSAGLMCCVFLAAIDQTIVTTALPTIVSQLGGGNNYGWVGSAYLLAAAALSPAYGKLSDVAGRKPILFGSIGLFLLGSVLCGAAQNLTWLMVARAIQGLGGGGMNSLVNIIIGDIVPLERRGFLNSLVGSTWGIASVLGPLIGGLFTDHVTWRWCFFVNLPFGAISSLILLLFLNLNPRPGRTFKEHAKEFDFVGLVLMLIGVLCLLLGFNFSETSWHSAETITLLAVGGVVLVVAGVYECFTTRSAILPARLFKTRTTAAVLVSSFLHAITFFNCAYYLPMFFQILGASATGAGLRMLPFSLGASIFSSLSGLLVTVTKGYRLILWTSWMIYATGLGLMIMLDSYSNLAQKLLFTFLTSVGCGALFMVPLIIVQSAMPLRDMATSTTAVGFCRLMGSAIGVALGQTIFTTTLQKRLADISNVPLLVDSASLSESVRHLSDIPDSALREQIIQAFAKSVSSIWLSMTPIAVVGFTISLLVRKYSLSTITSKAPPRTETANDLEENKDTGLINESPPVVNETEKI